jgi:hypothetical protein
LKELLILLCVLKVNRLIDWLLHTKTRQGIARKKSAQRHHVSRNPNQRIRCCSCFWFWLVLVPLFSSYTFLLHLNRVHPPPPISTLTNLLVIGCFHTGN